MEQSSDHDFVQSEIMLADAALTAGRQRLSEPQFPGDDDLAFVVLLQDLIDFGIRRPSVRAGLTQAKQLDSFATISSRIRDFLRLAGLGVGARRRLVLQTLPALFAALLVGDSVPELESQWRAAMQKVANRYVSSSERFSLNVMNIGLNLAQYNLFSQHDFPGWVLDLGSGNGYVSALFLERMKDRTVLSDLLPSALIAAKKYGFRQRIGIDMHNLPYASESFDTIVSIHSVDNAGARELTIAEAFRVLRPGGSLYYTDYLSHFFAERPLPRMLSSLNVRTLGDAYRAYAMRYSVDSGDLSSLSLDQHVSMLHNAGFQVAETRTFFGSRLFSYCYLMFDFDLLLRDQTAFLRRWFDARSTARLYRRITSAIILPLVYEDLQAQRPDQTQIFFKATKPGKGAVAGLAPRPVCVECHGSLTAGAAELQCEICHTAYPIVDGVPILVPRAMDAYRVAMSGRPSFKKSARSAARRLRSWR